MKILHHSFIYNEFMTINLSIAIKGNRKNVNKAFLGPVVFTASQLNNKSQDENCEHPH